MKKITLLLFIASVTLSCSTTKYDAAYHPLSEGVDFKIQNITLTKYSETGENAHYQYIAGKGGRIIQMFFKLRNNTSEKKNLSLKEFYVLDKNNKKYEPTVVVQTGKFNGMYRGDLEVKLKANKERTFIMNFKPAFDKNEKITRVLVNGKEYSLDMAGED